MTSMWGWIALGLTAFVALEHVGIMILEMFFWTSPFGLKAFNQTSEAAKASATLAANQGLYNGFLAAGLIWALLSMRRDVVIFFLACVLVAGLYGGLTAKRSILFVQALPAALALAAIFMTG